ncbi:hypothetical protein B0H11DRAFT_2193385 [Mycena galericulata]|nr:hypothetical protein B0H11DRAFT_2193385 [Mycena galericulata]
MRTRYPKTGQSDSSTAQGEQGYAHAVQAHFQPRQHDPWIWTNTTDGFEMGYRDADGAHARRAAAGTSRAPHFATLDPTTSVFAAQIGAVGRTDVVVSVHAGALGLTLFMSTGRAIVVELTLANTPAH